MEILLKFFESYFYLWVFISSFGTVVAVIFGLITYFRYRKEKQQKIQAQINAIIDEIYHNLNLAIFWYGDMAQKEIKCIVSELDKLDQTKRYPNPTDETGDPLMHRLFLSAYDSYDPSNFFNIAIDKRILFPLRNDAIIQSMAAGSAAVTLSKRIFLNLGHLDYSIRRFNLHIDIWNSLNKVKILDSKLVEHLKKVKTEYYLWLHFRLLFTFVDILRTYPSKHIYDKDTLSKYEKLAGSFWNKSQSPIERLYFKIGRGKKSQICLRLISIVKRKFNKS